MNIYVGPPKYGVNFARGWIGFTRCKGAVSDAIAYGERWQRSGRPEVTHALVVVGENECVEAQLGQGVILTTLSKYFESGATIFFRQPIGWSADLGDRIAVDALAAVGLKYNDTLIAEEAAYASVAGHALNTWLHDAPHRLLAKLLDKPKEFICSQLASYCLAKQPELRGRGVLSNPVDTISPQELFGDDVIFQPFANQIA